MKRVLVVLGAVLLLASSCLSAYAAGDDTSTAPVLNDGKKWRVAYYEGGQYPDYQMILKVILAGLENLGWLEVQVPEKYFSSHQEFWEWLADNIKSDYLEFVKDAYYSPGDFEEEMRDEVKAEFLKRLAEKNDIDFILALGTWAGQDLANSEHNVPTMVASSSDPVGSGIVKSVDDSGFDHLHAKVEPERYERQLRLFHDIVGFQRLGVVYEDSAEGRTFAALPEIKKVAEERGFEVVECHAPFNNVSLKEAEAAVVKCYKEIAPKVDAVYLTVHRGANPKNLPNILQNLYEHKVPSFSMLGSNEVRLGALMSIAQAGFKYVGQFHADTMAKILNGAKPRDLNQKWQDPPKIAINLSVAELIGYDPPVDIMMASDEIYEQIEKPTKMESE